MHEHLEKLKGLTAALTSKANNRPNGYRIQEVPKGEIFLFGLYRNTDVAIARCFSSAGADHGSSSHPEKEFFVVYSGELHITVSGEEHILKCGDFFVAEPNVAHEVQTPVPTWFLVMTIPGSSEFPRTDEVT